MIKVFLLVISFLIPFASYAALIGASNFEECMSDGKVGRTNAELYVLKKKCETEFPKLPKLYALKNAEISCVDTDKTTTDIYKINGKKVNNMPITYRKKEQIYFSGIKINVKNEGVKIAKSSIDTISGTLNIKFDALGEQKSFDFECEER